MTTHTRVHGDVGDTLAVRLNGVAEFTDATVIATVWQTDPVELPATVTNAIDDLGVACGRCVISFQDWLTTALGWYSIEYAVTFTDGTELTWPVDAPDRLHVRQDG